MELKGWRITENSSHVAAEEVCQMIERAKALEETGRYEEAAGALSHVWAGPGARPEVTGLEPSIAAELLLRAGTLTGWVGSAKQIEGAQEEAKNLIGEASALFASTGEQARAANASIDLAICYWREGALSEARVILKDVLDRAPDSADVTSRALLNMSVVEVSANRYRDALACLERARPIFDAKEDAVSKGRFHNQLALVLRNIGSDENRNDLLEAALIEYAAASGYFEQAGHSRYVARVANNVGHLLFRLGRYDEAIQHMDRARALLISFSDSGTVAQINEDRARVFLAMNRHLEAEISASKWRFMARKTRARSSLI